MGTSSIIIWIDPNITNGQNTAYSIYLKICFSGVKLFKSVNLAMEFLKTIKFAETKVIVSGKLYIDFIQEYEKNMAYLFTIPKIFIFTYHIDHFIKGNSQYKKMIDNPLYNYGGIQTDFEKITKLLMQKSDIFDKSSITTQLNKLKKDEIIEIIEYQEKEFTQEEEMTFDIHRFRRKIIHSTFL